MATLQSADILPNAAISARMAIRRGALARSTAAMAPGFVQGNIIILPSAHADAFAGFCEANVQACPLLARSLPGDPTLPTMGADVDMRFDLPLYRVFRDGALVEQVQDIEGLWRDDLVTFVIGCSFTFDSVLVDAGIYVRHLAQERNVSMYRTNRQTVASGPFGGELVVSMRPIRSDEVDRAAALTARFPRMHGAPVHVGDPSELGIKDLARPDFGDSVEIAEGEVPVFWACGVTSQVAVEAAHLPLFVAHAPGQMLITDRPRQTMAS